MLGEGRHRRCHCRARDLPGEVGNRHAGNVTEGNLLRAGDAREFLNVDEKRQEDDGSIRYRMPDFPGWNELPFAALNTRQHFSQERDEIPGRFPGH